ncbi:Glutaredoxin [Tenacibaculum sp. MAR_2010_89]|uniref:glutaredoxin domain-containing protein n=1 Tax=Tenacibaculum sp. MAR_2010_89 TaxID=1250198 RepID=UPI00089626A3|nr:Glutaredoxin [Tenacibaculum sp. MAR_2010_89]
MIIKLYGAQRCHKTIYYQEFFLAKNIDFIFLDVEKNSEYAQELRKLYENKKLNFPTITIGKKKTQKPFR